MRFQNPQNGHVEKCDSPWLWSLLFGFFYFAVKGIWTHAVVGVVLGLFTLGLSWLVYPFFARSIVRNHYLRKGWINLDGTDEEEDEIESAKNRIIRRGRAREKELRSQPKKEADLNALLERAGKRMIEKQRRATNDDSE